MYNYRLFLIINTFTLLDAYPSSVIDGIINKITQYRVFSTTDLESTYHQIPIHQGEKPCTDSKGNENLYLLNCMPLTLSIVPNVSRDQMIDLFRKKNSQTLFHILIIYMPVKKNKKNTISV